MTEQSPLRAVFVTAGNVMQLSSHWDRDLWMATPALSRSARLPLALALSSLLYGCAAPEVPVEIRVANALPAVSVTASAETDPVGTAAADAADDPALWRNPANPGASLIVGTDKKAGLHIYSLDGRSRHFNAAGLVNNVDLFVRDGRILVVASDRNDLRNSHLALFRLDPSGPALVPLGRVATGPGEAYGICIDADRSTMAEVHVFAAIKDGSVRQLIVRPDAAGGPSAQLVRTMKLATQIEGCVVDPATRSLFVGEEDVGIWRFSADADGPLAGRLVVPADTRQLVADVEGLALVRHAGRTLLVASSQGDNAYALFDVPAAADGNHALVGRFRIAAGRFGATSETDGIELMLGDFGADYPEGLFVAQDGENEPAAQNFKLVGWREIKAALGL